MVKHQPNLGFVYSKTLQGFTVMNWILWFRIRECMKTFKCALYSHEKRLPGNGIVVAPKSGSKKRLTAPKSGPKPSRHVLICRVVSYVRICLNWLPGTAQGATNVWLLPGWRLLRKGSLGGGPRSRNGPWAPTVLPIFFCCAGLFPMLMVDGRVFGTYFRGLWLYLVKEYTIFMTI